MGSYNPLLSEPLDAAAVSYLIVSPNSAKNLRQQTELAADDLLVGGSGQLAAGQVVKVDHLWELCSKWVCWVGKRVAAIHKPPGRVVREVP
mmetsp:Transcript_22889/g.32761  ORF Transcript_22889/g.32761 Transcript_22889/m.32761 type:complete len:91 (+) Transcript_22889:52-324(+)